VDGKGTTDTPQGWRDLFPSLPYIAHSILFPLLDAAQGVGWDGCSADGLHGVCSASAYEPGGHSFAMIDDDYDFLKKQFIGSWPAAS